MKLIDMKQRKATRPCPFNSPVELCVRVWSWMSDKSQGSHTRMAHDKRKQTMLPLDAALQDVFRALNTPSQPEQLESRGLASNS
jgi:hypothetical protein